MLIVKNTNWFNLWRKQNWPYSELKEGDFLLWYDSKIKSVLWKTKVVDVDRFEYKNIGEVITRIKEHFGSDPTDDPYRQDVREENVVTKPHMCVAALTPPRSTPLAGSPPTDRAFAPKGPGE